MRKITKYFSVLLAVCMLFGALPMTVLAGSGYTPDLAKAESMGKFINSAVGKTDTDYDFDTYDTEDTTAEKTNDFAKIVLLDCGRKYFSADWIKALITEMADAGYNQLTLAFGNDGLRFLLDDMSFTANGTTYESKTVVEKVVEGNKAQNSSGDESYLTETEMNGIIEYATSKGIEIVPLLNLPGHADAILDIFDDKYNASGSNNTFDIDKEEGLNCAYEIFKKYVDYFASKGCKYFNFGADEYANDASGTFSFSRLDSTQYGKFVSFINKLAGYIKGKDIDGKNMTPRSFNDGLYYNGQTIDTTTYKNITSIQCCYWSSGWSSYKVASASTIAGNGHDMINTNGDYYYVLGKDDKWTEDETEAIVDTTHVPSLYTRAKDFSNTAFMDSTISDPVGSMFCIWCDYPTAEDETQVAQNVRLVLRAMGARMNDKTVDSISTELVDGGFDENGKIYTATTTTPDTGDGDSNTATAPEETPTFEGEDTVTKAEGGTAEKYELASSLESGSKYLIVSGNHALSHSGNSAVNLTVTPSTDGSNTVTPNGDATNALWEYTESKQGGNTTKTLKNGTYYISPGNNSLFGTSSASLTINKSSGTTNAYTICKSSGGKAPGGNDKYYVRYNSGWTTTNNSNSATALSFYKYTASTEAWKVTPEKQQNRINYYAEKTNDNYTTDSWTAYQTALSTAQAKLTEVTGKNYATKAEGDAALAELIKMVDSLESAYKALVKNVEIKIIYVLADGTEVTSETKTVAENATSVALSNFNSGDKYYTVPYATLEITPKTVTKYEVTVTESTEDLSKVSPLTVEYWITNRAVTPTGIESTKVTSGSATTKIYSTYAATVAGVHTENGIAFEDLVPKTGEQDEKEVELWKGSCLDSDNYQTNESNDDETKDGATIERVRYYNKKWSYFDGTNWVDIQSSDQIVAYYWLITEVTDEITTKVVDWAQDYAEWKKGTDNSWFWNGYVENGSKYVFLDYAVVYEDGTQNPSTFPNDNTWFYHFDECSAEKPRVIGLTGFEEDKGYEIWKITVTDGTSSGYSSALTFKSSYDDSTETVVWDESMDSEPHIDSLVYTANRTGKLVRVYVRAKKTDDSLTVIYYDEKFDAQLYTYPITVENGKNFENGIIPSTPPAFSEGSSRINVSGYGIVNTLNVTQYFQTDLTKVPEAVGKYNSGLYTYTGSEIKDDGKTLYLYYTINTEKLSPNYVVDFGLPITFPLSDVVTGVATVKTVTVNEKTKYGKLTYDSGKKEFTYTPNTILPTYDVLTINILFDGESDVTTTNVGVTPATTVYYEESFIDWGDNDSGWTSTGTTNLANNGKQTTEKIGAMYDSNGNRVGNNYGYDPAYDTTSASDTSASSGTVGSSGTFTFTGNGVQVFANCTDKGTNRVAVEVRNEDSDKIVTLALVDTNVAAGSTGATNGQTGNMDGLPIVSLVDVKNLPHGTYTVKITKIVDNQEVKIDGIRIFNTIKDDGEESIYKADLEDNPDFYELRDAVLKQLNVTKDTSEDYNQNLYEQVYKEVEGQSAVIISADGGYKDETGYVTDLLDNGPKNELFLYNGQTLTFKVKTKRVMQLGLKAPQGATNVEITVNGTKLEKPTTINSSVDMFYVLNDKPTTDATEYTVSVKNTGDKLLSVTLLKICDDPSAAFVPFSAKDIAEMVGYDGFNEDQLPADVEAYAYLPIIVKGADGETLGSTTISHFGKKGETHTFTADEIESALSLILPDGYVLSDTATYTDVEVKYGVSHMGVTFLASPDVETPDDDNYDFGFDYDAWFAQMMYLQSIRNNQKKNNTVNDTTKEEPEITEPETTIPEIEPVEETTVNPFADVAETDWYFEDVAYAYENGLMIGTSDTEFSPNAIVNRAMLVTILWRLEGSPAPTNTDVFTDVPNDEWYTDAVNWAAEIGIVNGYGDGTFGALDDLTREQIMAILNRYADYKGWTDGIIVPMLPQYTYSAWSENNTIWADMCGLLNGIGKDVTDLTLAADRAEMAAYLRRFRENIAK